MSALASGPVPDAFEARTNATFEALMWALSRPGTVQDLPSPDVAGIAEALLDRECRVFCDNPLLAGEIASFGAALVPMALADYCFISLEDARGLAQLVHVPVGSDLYPDAGATLIAAARFGTGAKLRLTGPGIETSAEFSVDGLAAELWSLRAAHCRYPAGFDLFLICGAQVIGLPRSTQIEVL
ncbi:MAG: phosphonate C-P lyase system protein PhnH [Hoeflea sp.]|uniref:phosphonate C-P lyase system protein PhnH n=1 Tax=Hoeflea sp. TaxID=1940281 RepID=UPI0027322750|nr:phosphonate C-P lyase system protein PhnH [Hoeflea sp.]MDP2118574.1 phosphonate C-P lyase system protein PhnH [Hoeflea sp.]